jgi:hypothetical protein
MLDADTLRRRIIEVELLWHMRGLILKQGRVRFGKPTKRQLERLKAIDDLDRLDRIAITMLSARSWTGLLRTR